MLLAPGALSQWAAMASQPDLGPTPAPMSGGTKAALIIGGIIAALAAVFLISCNGFACAGD
jgi:hypothetical protein